MVKLLLSLSLTCFMTLALAEDMMLKVINLKYKSAKQVLPLVEPYIMQGGHISGQGKVLIVNTSRENLTELRYLLHKIDVAPVVMRVSVRQGTALDSPQALRNNQVMTTYDTSSYQRQKSAQSVQVESGQAAFVQTGEDIPVITAGNYGDWNIRNFEKQKQSNYLFKRKQTIQGRERKKWLKKEKNTSTSINRYAEEGMFGGFEMEYRQLKTGFWILPTVEGNRVQVQIYRQRQSISRFGQTNVNTQATKTTLLIPWGKWVALSANQDAQTLDKTSFNYQTGDQFQKHSTIFIKVEKMD